MKSPLIYPVLFALALSPIGCEKKDSTDLSAPASSSAMVDTSKIEAAFASAEPAVKAEFNKVVAAVKGADWAGAGAKIQELAGNVKLSEEQKTSLKSLAEQLKAKAAAMMAQTKEQAAKMTEKAKEVTGQALDGAGKMAEKAKEATGKAVEGASKSVGDLLPKK